jgi:hypothetical protein
MTQNLVETAVLHKVLDPRGQPTGALRPLTMAPRLDSLEGKTIYLIDIGFGGGYEFLEEVQASLTQKMPSLKTVLRRKPGNMLQNTPEFWTEVKENSNAVIFGVGG